MPFGDSDLPAFFGDFGVDVTFNGVTVLGLMDNPVAVKLADRGFGGFETQMPALRLPYNAFTVMPVETDQITVDGVLYSVSERTAEGDGKIVCYALKAVQ